MDISLAEINKIIEILLYNKNGVIDFPLKIICLLSGFREVVIASVSIFAKNLLKSEQ